MKRDDRYARDPSYGRAPNWSALYDRYFPAHTDGCSRHTKLVANDILRDPKSPVRRMLIDAGYEPDHWAQSLEITVKVLWETRAHLERVRQQYEPEKLAAEKAALTAKINRRLGPKASHPGGEPRGGERSEVRTTQKLQGSHDD